MTGNNGEKLTPPPGTKPLMISMREMDTLGLKIGPGLRETVEYRIFDKQHILDEIQQVGFMCPFHEHRAEITKMDGTQVLLVADKEEIYGENWLLCVRQAAFDAQMVLIKQRESQADALLQEEADAKREDMEVLVEYEDKPFVAMPWISATAEQTSEEVAVLTVKGQRPVITMSITRRAEEFNADYKFSDRDADQCFVECRQHKDPNYELTRMEQDIGLQGILDMVDGTTQTSWFRAVNSALQYEPMKIPRESCEKELESGKMHAFLQYALPLMEEALQQNETLDIFLDPLANLAEEDMGHGNKTESSIKELRTFTDLVFSKNKTLPSIDWHPKKSGVVIVAASANASFSKRGDSSDKVIYCFFLS